MSMSCGVGFRHGLGLLWLWHRLTAAAPIRPLARYGHKKKMIIIIAKKPEAQRGLVDFFFQDLTERERQDSDHWAPPRWDSRLSKWGGPSSYLFSDNSERSLPPTA